MFGYKLLKIVTFFIYWLGFAPWLVLILRKEEIISTSTLEDVFLQYTTVLFILIIIYLIIHRMFEYFYLRHTIKKTVRKVTVRHQLTRLKKGEIDLEAAQRVSTFMKLKEKSAPSSSKKVVRSGTKQQQQQQQKKKEEKEVKPVINKDLSKGVEKCENKAVITDLENFDNKDKVKLQEKNEKEKIIVKEEKDEK